MYVSTVTRATAAWGQLSRPHSVSDVELASMLDGAPLCASCELRARSCNNPTDWRRHDLPLP